MARAQRAGARGSAHTMSRWLWAALLLASTAAHAWLPPSEPLLLTPVLQPRRHRRDVRLDTPHSVTMQIYGWLVELEDNSAIRAPFDDECRFYKGTVHREDDSYVAVTECNGQLYGLLQVRGDEFVLQPTVHPRDTHVLRRRGVTLTDEPPAFDLAGDTVTDLELSFDEDYDNEVEVSRPQYVGLRRKGDNDIEYSHYNDVPIITRSISGEKQLRLELAIVADHTMMKFHGRDRVNHYILALMNIVSAIFNDPSLNSNITLVINKLFLYEEDKHIVTYGNAKKSLDAVNKWNYKHLDRLPSGKSGWDAAVWLTRAPLGGPSGFAPVGGVCSRDRSAAIDRDEGLTSAFVIAHEIAHLLGLSHDGEGKCDEESRRGTVMATTVLATLHKYAWSTCSEKQFHENSRFWWCMQERRHSDGVVLGGLKELSNYIFTMDEQCRTEFGEGYSVCKAVKIRSPCARLWCAHRSLPQVCRSKHAPPLEGTPCGYNHWCVDRHCEPMPGNDDVTVEETNEDVEPNTPASWGEWSAWSGCDASCGYGLRVRMRHCQRYNSSSTDCEGASTETSTCWSGRECAARRDIRTSICRRHSFNFIPYWPSDESKYCELLCVNHKGGAPTALGSLPDGTACSYDRPYDLCFQGECVRGECNTSDPHCNWCSDGYCNNNTIFYYPKLRRGSVWTRMMVIPHDAHRLSVHVTTPIPLKIAVRDKGRNKLSIELHKHSTRRFDTLEENIIKYDPNVPQNLQVIELDDDFVNKREEDKYGYEGHIMVAGSVLKWNQTSGDIFITSSSPLQSDLMILGARQHFDPEHSELVALEVSVNYSTPATRSRHTGHRLHTERGPCSVSCGGGQRWVRSRCLPGRGCLPLHYESCNTLRCEFAWGAGEWETCSATCGEAGVQERQLFCVPTADSGTTSRIELIERSVSPALCSSTRASVQPAQRPCNRVPCPVYWEELPWTPCSTTCGRGVSRRPLVCRAADAGLCGPKPEERRKRCRLRRCPVTPRPAPACTGPDASQYCEFFPPDQLTRNCELPIFRKYCCNSCRDNDISRIGHG